MPARNKWGVQQYSTGTPALRSTSRARTWPPGPSTRPPASPAALCCDGSRWPPPLPRQDRVCSNPCGANRPAALFEQRAPDRSAYRIRPAGHRFLRVRAYQSPASPTCVGVTLGPILAPGSIMRISFMGIMGRKRTNNRNRNVNNPSVPTNVMKSHFVARYVPQDDGKKSRYRLVTTMTKRSNHMPVFTTIEMKNMNGIDVRSLRDHSVVSGIARLQVISTQYDQPIGPNTRFQNMNASQCDAEYQAMKASMP